MDVTEFHFLRPYWLTLVVPWFGLLGLMASTRLRWHGWNRIVEAQLRPYVIRTRVAQSKWPFWLIGLAGILSITALAGPTWERLPTPLYQGQASLVIALDLSRSMDATDMAPSRLARARFKIADLLWQRREGQTALLVYGGAAFTVTPLTTDTETITIQLPVLKTDILPAPGSRADLALEHAATLLQQVGAIDGHVLLITDYSDPTRDPAAAKRLADHGYTVSVLGVGTPQGAPIPTDIGDYLKDTQGRIVIPKLDEATLRLTAKAGGGLYHPLTSDTQDLKTILAQTDHPLKEQATQTKLHAHMWRDEGAWLLLPVLIITALAFRRGILAITVICLVPLPQPVRALEWDQLWTRPEQRAQHALATGKAAQAAELFTQPDWKGAAYYRAGQFAQALHEWSTLKTADDWYNRANALARLGRYPEALTAYTEALEREPKHEDARHNRDLINEQLRQQESNTLQPPPQTNPANGAANPDSPPQEITDAERQGAQAKEPASSQTTPQSGGPSDHTQPPNAQPDEAKPDLSEEDTPQDPTAAHRAPASPSQPAPTPDPDSQSAETQQADEAQQALAQWLRRIPDDPGGLLRRKFLYQYQGRMPHDETIQPW